MKKLNIDEIMALQMSGLSVGEILKTDLDAFDALYEEKDELEEYLEKANEILDRQEAQGIFGISCQDALFPKRLLAIGKDCPAVIFCKGNRELLDKERAVAIIGARAADKAGNEKAYRLGADYAKNGFVIVSGLALGCDASAHRGCLDSGGETIAIVGNGLDIVHPRENKSLQDRILSNGGLMLSEQVIGMKANPRRLVARNRLQAALSEAVILAQCPEKSGSLYTMEFARKYKKRSLATVFPRWYEENMGNKILLDNSLAEPV